MSREGSWLSAAEACRVLEVTAPTLYAYVSRGFVRSEAQGRTRNRRYSRDDVERLRRRRAGRRDPDAAAADALRWGLPILESGITLIADNALYYRGHDAIELAGSRSLHEVASLVWTGRFDRVDGRLAPPRIRAASDRRLPFAARAQTALALAAAADPRAADLRADAVACTGWRIVSLLTAVAAGSRRFGPTVEETLARAWRVGPPGADALRVALVLCADHELNVSSFTARCVASAGSNPYAVVGAALGALEGTRHGGISLRVEALLRSLRGTRQRKKALDERLRRGESIDGFGHPLYRDGDPRAAAMLDLLRRRYPRSAELAFVLGVADAAAAVVHERPTIDFALAALAHVLRLPAGTPLVLFALGRTIGWVGHAVEQYASGQIIRPRARYVGVPPQ